MIERTHGEPTKEAPTPAAPVPVTAGSPLLDVQRKAGNRATNALLQRKAEGASAADGAPNRTGLPDNLKSGIENLSGVTLDDVKVHYNSAMPAQLNALAYAQGTDIHIGPGQEKHLPHEAWHVVQQKGGRVQPTVKDPENPGVMINDDKGLEAEADAMGGKAASGPVGPPS